ncbi:MAG: hypothetical protein H7Z41_17950 [Cytophagales bacterium]|nr:hypothetical protein [Armatimonadota bacterium]
MMAVFFFKRPAVVAVLSASVLSALLAGGCAVDKEATPSAEVSAAVQTRDAAKAIQSDSQGRVKDADAVLEGK